MRLQKEIWGFEDIELLPRRLFAVASKIGGQVLGAFDKGRMVAFCLCIPGLKAGGRSYLHSHMLGVLPAYRNTGLGRRMKLAQREYASQAGIDLIEWTFDPLELKNAFFNIERLGVIVRRYVRNQYGTTSSYLHGGLPTDRLVPEWWISSPWVTKTVEGLDRDQVAVEDRLAVPSEIALIRKEEPSRARAIQTELAKQFQRCFDEGLAVIGFERTETAGTYLLGKWPFK